MRLHHRDKGYAWVVVGAGSIVMFVGPSTYTGYGTLFAETEMSANVRLWLLTLTSVLWFGIATIAGSLQLLNTNRKLVMFGLFAASCGMALTGVVSPYPPWMFLTFSTIVGIGIGTAVHETFLLVVCHFERYRGLAIGVLCLSAILGQITTPLIYETMADVKDRCYIRALMTAIAFMSASFYISPHLGPIIFQSNEELRRKTTRNSSHKRKSRERSTRSNSSERADGIPLVPLKETQINIQAQHQTYHHHSQEDPVFFLPNIPEETESITSIGTNSSRERMEEIKISPIDPQLEKRIDRLIKKSKSTSEDTRTPPQQIQKNRPPIKPLNPELVRKVEEKINSGNGSSRPRINQSAKNTSSIRARSNTGQSGGSRRGSIFRYRLDSIFDPEIDFMEVRMRRGSEGPSEGGDTVVSIAHSHAGYTWKEALMETDWSLLRNWKFLVNGMSVALTVLAFPNFSIIFTSHLLAIHSKDLSKGDIFSNVESILILIYVSDAVGRISMGYFSDFSMFNRKIAFNLAAFTGGCLIVGIPFVRDPEVINVICCIFGICHGTLNVTESLLFADEFGMRKLPSSYGLVNAGKAVIILLLTPVIKSPVSGFMYPIQPFLKIKTWNSTLCHQQKGCDPFYIFNHGEDSESTLQKTTLLCMMVGFCGISSGVSCAIEVLINFIQMLKTKKEIKTPESDKIIKSFPFKTIKRERSNSNP